MLLFARAASPVIYDRIIDGLRAAGLDPSIIQELEDANSVNAFVAQGLGWHVAPSWVSDSLPAGLVLRRVRGLNIPFGIDVVWRVDDTSACVRSFVDLVLSRRDNGPAVRARVAEPAAAPQTPDSNRLPENC
jgi:DNA-binding transcriptional LysR family regulator